MGLSEGMDCWLVVNWMFCDITLEQHQCAEGGMCVFRYLLRSFTPLRL